MNPQLMNRSARRRSLGCLTLRCRFYVHCTALPHETIKHFTEAKSLQCEVSAESYMLSVSKCTHTTPHLQLDVAAANNCAEGRTVGSLILDNVLPQDELRQSKLNDCDNSEVVLTVLRFFVTDPYTALIVVHLSAIEILQPVYCMRKFCRKTAAKKLRLGRSSCK
jgi:hypothetical protein